MKSENQVCTLEQAKKLKELGIKQRSFFGWIELEKTVLISRHTSKQELSVYNTLAFETLSAFNVAELGVMLPVYCDTAQEFCDDKKTISWWRCDEGLTADCRTFHADTEAEARAAMLIYLLENNLATATEVNNRLSL